MVFEIKLEKPSGEGYKSGSWLEGSILFEVKEVVTADNFVAHLQGEEYSQVKYEKDEEGNRQVKYANATRSLVHIEIPVKKSDLLSCGKVIPGSYVMPFEIQLPDGLPSSMSVDHNGSECKVRYTIKAQLVGKALKEDYACSKAIRVVAKPLSSDPVPYRRPPIETPMGSCCFWDQGSIIFGAHVSNTVLGRGEEVDVHLTCRNYSKVDIESITATVAQRVQWKADREKEKQPLEKLAVFNFSYLTAEGLQGAARDKQKPSEDKWASMELDLAEARYSDTVQIPFPTMETFRGQLITVQHFIRVVVETDGSSASDPEVWIPLEIGSPKTAQDIPREQAMSTDDEGSFDFNNSTTAMPILVKSDDAQLGGSVRDLGDSICMNEEIIVEPETHEPRPPSVENLFLDMKESLNVYDLIHGRLADKKWKDVISSMTEMDYGRLIRRVVVEFDQPKVAEMVARVIPFFYCSHVVAAISGCKEWNRATVIHLLLPHTKDFAENKDIILAQLTDWEKTVTKDAFELALETQ